jgi:hypothetical protein
MRSSFGASSKLFVLALDLLGSFVAAIKPKRAEFNILRKNKYSSS